MAGRKSYWPDCSFSDNEGAIPPPLRTLNTPGPIRQQLVFSLGHPSPPPRAPLPAPNYPANFLNTPVRGASPAGVFGSPAPRPPMPRPPPGARPPLSFSPVLPQNRGPPAIQPEIRIIIGRNSKIESWTC